MGVSNSERSPLFKALVVSGVFHACLLTGIYHSTALMTPEGQTFLEPVNSIDIIMVERNPQKASITEGVVENLAKDTGSEREKETEGLVESVENSIPISESDLASDLAIKGQAAAKVLDSRSAGVKTTLNPSEVTSAISSYMKSYRESSNKEWLNNCIRYKNQHASKECPQEHGENDIRPVYRDYELSRKKSGIARFEFMESVIKANDLSAGNLYSINQVKLFYKFLVDPEPAWTPYMAEDKFNPELIGPKLSFIGYKSGEGLSVLGFTKNAGLGVVRIMDNPVLAVKEEPDDNKFKVITPLFPVGR